MRACARLAFVFFALGAGLGLTGCTTIDELKDTMSGWFGTGKSVGEHAGVFPGELPGADRMPPEKILGEKATKASKKTDKPASKLEPLQKVGPPKKPPVSVSTEAVGRQQGVDAQSASSQAAPLKLRTPWPQPPASGTFSR